MEKIRNNYFRENHFRIFGEKQPRNRNFDKNMKQFGSFGKKKNINRNFDDNFRLFKNCAIFLFYNSGAHDPNQSIARIFEKIEYSELSMIRNFP